MFWEDKSRKALKQAVLLVAVKVGHIIRLDWITYPRSRFMIQGNILRSARFDDAQNVDQKVL